MFKKILIANRGEIAVRVMRACRELGIATVAVYSEADREALHVRRAEEACPLGPSAASESYLNIEKLLDAARRTGAQAIHPGYGFLSENAEFARRCTQAGVKFIGPGAAAMEQMGSKTRARQIAAAAGVPLLAGSGTLGSVKEAEAAAEGLGYPVLVKAAAGGGGKGMRQVHEPAEMRSAFAAAESEALNAFGNAEVYLEKLLERPRHIEVQILGDEHGTLVYLGERECSLQRRHQKVLEEAPSPVVDEALRRRMGETAVRAAQAAGYTNAGTVEFLMDSGQNFYFLEMNTRLQVEHPVTEMVTGLDLVQLQIRIAAGEKLPIEQKDVQIRGHAIECRIYAEDPENGFFPSPGKITRLLTPAGPGIRDESGVYEGWTVPLEYDPLLSKLVAHAGSRAEAIARMERALAEYFVGGIATNLALFRRILRHPEFVAGKMDTGFLERLLAEPAAEGGRATPGEEGEAGVAAIAAALFAALPAPGAAVSTNGALPAEAPSAWKRAARQEGLRGEELREGSGRKP
ncbi:MAG: acetyl-CoA carboxylase biotin carboxylase subunit [Acidobacteriota bacterium]|nr:acetyl-CoA carboxylase biotin carboxylase subunit [Acidobacteriota bacterium]